MAFQFQFAKSFSLSILISLSFLLHPIFSLSTIAISETSNDTIVCALVINQQQQQQSFLNCTSLYSRLQIPITSSQNSSLAGVVAGDGFVCLLRSPNPSQSSTMIMGCWRFSGDNTTHMSYKRIYKGPALTELEAGNSHICGLTEATLQLQCWQWPGFHPTTHFISIAVGEDFLCGLSKTGMIKCMVRSNTSASNVVGHEPREGHFSAIAAGFRHACAVSSWGELVCWGDAGQLPQPDRGFAAVALGENCSCAQRLNGTVVCWGENNFKLPESLRNAYFTTIVAKRSVFCGVLSNFSLICWGRSQVFETMNVYNDVLPGPCRNECLCGEMLPDSGKYCSSGYVCRPSVEHYDPSRSEPPSQPPNPNDTPSSSHNNIKSVSLIAVGSVGSFSLIMTICFWLYEYCRGRICRVYDSSRLDEIGTSTRSSSTDHQGQQARSLGLERRLSHLVSLGNACPLKEFPLQVLLQATDNFSQDHKIGSGSFGSVYYAVLEDGCEVAIKRAETTSSSSSFAHVYPRGTKRQEDKDLAFLNELEFLSRLNHKNLVHLLGFCEDCNERILIHRVLDPNVPPPTPFEIEAVAYTGYLAVDCVMLEGRDRPSMTEIVNGLERALAACLPAPLLSTSLSYASSPSKIVCSVH
ncbi:Protein kinase domain [Dillenia turbinata]|uniref:Protein kinase domain n=1 Tax=Dillenia turbinata TaxID=194707 RepID=A0AAN8ZKX7_9MAGN